MRTMHANERKYIMIWKIVKADGFSVEAYKRIAKKITIVITPIIIVLLTFLDHYSYR